jgi:hypothetical protein
MSLDHHDPVAIDAFAAEVDEALERNAPRSALWMLVLAWVLVGGVLTLAQGVDAGWLYPLGLAGVVFWVMGLMAARRPARWWNS